jgi:hypothetical protein
MGIISIEKVDDSNISVIRETDPVPAKIQSAVVYDYDFLKQQKQDIQHQWDAQLKEINDARGAEMAEVDFLISEADKIGVKSTPTEVVEVIV